MRFPLSNSVRIPLYNFWTCPSDGETTIVVDPASFKLHLETCDSIAVDLPLCLPAQTVMKKAGWDNSQAW